MMKLRSIKKGFRTGLLSNISYAPKTSKGHLLGELLGKAFGFGVVVALGTSVAAGTYTVLNEVVKWLVK